MSKIEPAMKPEEWSKFAPLDRTLEQHVPNVAQVNAHGAAALALHRQPFGFTWDDYYELWDYAHEIVRDCGPPQYLLPETKHQVNVIRSIATRIAALLPPRDSQV